MALLVMAVFFLFLAKSPGRKERDDDSWGPTLELISHAGGFLLATLRGTLRRLNLP